VGEALGSSLSRIADADLFAGLAQHYRSSFDDLQTAIGDVEKEFKVDPDVGLSGIDLWGGVDQVPLKHPLDGDWSRSGAVTGSSSRMATTLCRSRRASAPLTTRRCAR